MKHFSPPHHQPPPPHQHHSSPRYDLEAWFPGSNAHRELVSCSNCTDFQARRLEVRYGQSKADDGKKHYVHMLNSTLIATERAMCCVIENYQTPTGIKVPLVLRKYMNNVSFIPFVNNPPKPKKGATPPVQHVPTAEELEAMRGDRHQLQKYMDAIEPQLNAALNAIARDRPERPLEALAQLLSAAEGGAAAPAAPAPAAPAASAAPAAAAADFDIVAHDKAELEKKKAAEAKKQAEKDAIEAENLKKMAEIESTGKRAAGGLHKFDPDEVDVHGGDATADDFMDAFGF